MMIPGKLRRASFVAGLTTVLTLVPTAAFGAWLSDGDGSTGVTATSVNKASKPSVEAGEGSVTISWARSTLASGDSVGYYDVLRDGAPVCSSADVDDATASCTDPEPAGHEVIYRVVAGIGTNWTGPASDGTDFTYDTTAPDAPSAPDLIADDDTGSSDDDNITSKSTVTVTGTAEAGSTVRIYRGTTELASGTATGGNYSIAIALIEGENTIHATATDAAGNISSSSTVTVILRDSAGRNTPSAPDLIAADDTGSSNTDNLTNKSTVTLTGTADSGSIVHIFRGTTELGSGTAAGGAYSISINLVAGTNAVFANASDAAGNTSANSGTTTITLDNTPPSPAPSTPDLATADDTGVSSTDNVTNKATVLVTGTAGVGATVKIVQGTTELASGTAAGGNYSISITLPSEGANVIHAAVFDDAGNVAASGTLTITRDQTAPTVVMQYPTASSTINNGQWNNGNCADAAPAGVGAAGLCGTADGTGSAVVSVEYELRATTPNPDTCFPGSGAFAAASCGTWRSPTQLLGAVTDQARRWGISVAFGTIPTGSNELRVRVVDAAGNASFGTAPGGTATVTFTK